MNRDGYKLLRERFKTVVILGVSEGSKVTRISTWGHERYNDEAIRLRRPVRMVLTKDVQRSESVWQHYRAWGREGYNCEAVRGRLHANTSKYSRKSKDFGTVNPQCVRKDRIDWFQIEVRKIIEKAACKQGDVQERWWLKVAKEVQWRCGVLESNN